MLQSNMSFPYLEQEIDGEVFLDLPDEQIKLLVPKIGPQTKMLRRRQMIRKDSNMVCAIILQVHDYLKINI